MAFNAFNTLQSSLTGSNKPARLQILSFYQYQPGNRNFIGKTDVYMLVDITYLETPPLLQDIIGILQQNSIDTLNSINMPQNYYPSQNFNQNCGCFGGQSCPRIPTTTTQPPPPTTASCISEKVLCNTIIGIDTSSDILTPDLYQRVINVIEQNISMQIQDFTKYGLLSYDTKIRNYHGIGSITSQSNFNSILSSFKQYPGSSLKTLLQYYVSLLSNINNPIAFISFISEKPVIDSDTINYANQIMSKAKLYFIITGDDLKSSDLQGISSSPPFEFEFGDCNIIGLNETFSDYTICDVSCSPTTTSTTTESTTTISTTTQCIPITIPCNPNLIFAVDSSKDKLDYQFFVHEINYIQYNLSTLFSNYDYSRISLTSYSDNVLLQYPFGSISNYAEYILDLQNILYKNQSSGSSLTNLMTNLNNLQQTNSDPISTYIFISEIDNNDVMNAVEQARILKSKGQLYFIILGIDVRRNQLDPLQPTDVTQWLLSDCGEQNITDFVHNGFICQTDCGTTTTTTTPPPSTTRCPEGTKVCYSNVRIYVDSSNDILYPPLFTQEQSLLTNNITNIIPHDFSQLAVLSQNKLFQNQEYGFGSISGRQQFIDTIRLLQQGPGYMLSEILSSLYNTIPRNSYPTSTFVFLSDKTKIDLSNSYQVAQNLKSNGNTLYFILLGTAIKMEDVAPLMATNTTIWQFSDCGEQFILDFFNDGFICSYECGTTTTSTTTPTPTATPCIDGQTQCNIVIGMDTSYDILIPTLYQSTLDVIQQNISGQILDFSKVALIAYDYDVHEFHDFGTIKDRNQFNNIVGNYQQHVGSNLKVLLKYLNNLPNYGHMNYVIFISENQAFDNEVYQLAYSLKNKGNLQFIILGTDINPTDLSSLGSSNSLYYNFGDCNIPDLINSFTRYLNCTNICSSTPPPITTSPPCRSSTEPCNPNLMFAFDASSVTLDEHYFTNEKLFFLNNISSFIQNDPFYQNNYDHIALIPYNSIVSTSFTFGRIMNNDMYIKDVSSIQQGPGNGLMNLLDVLYKQTPVNSDPIATYIFLSNVTSKDIQESIELSKLLFNKGTLSFIIVGTSVNIQQLDPLYKTNITVWSGAECEIGDLLKIMKNSMVCNDYCSTTTTTTTTTTTSTPTTTPCPPSQLICDPNMIFAVDVSSDSMKQEYFNSELALLNNNTFISLINDFKRVDLAYYSYQAVNFKSFGSINNIYEWYQDVGYINNTIQQSPGSDLNSLLSTLSVYLHEVDVPIDQKPVSTYIFISNNDSIYDSTKTYAQYIRSRGSLNFIILGTAIKPEVLQQLTPLSNIIQWEFAKCTIQDVVQFIKNTFTCYCTSSTTTSTTTTTTTTTTTPQQPYVCDVIFSVDSSSDTLSGEDFNYEKSIIINNIPNIIKDFTRVAVSSYDYNDVRTLNFGTLKNSGDFIKFINETTQNQGTSLTSELINLNLLTFNGPNKIPVFIFIGTKDPLDLMNAIPEAQKLSKHVNLYFIIVGTYVKRSDLANLVPLNNIYVWDFANCPVAQLMNFIAKYGSCDSTITTTQQPSPVFKDSPYSPCESSLVFAISTSEDMLNDDLYENELNLFTNNYLIDEDFNHFERIGIVGYNDIPEVIIQFNQTANLEDFTVQVTSGIQKNRNKGNSLVNLLQQLTNDYFFNYDYGLTKNYFIFITNTTTNDITNSISYANIINNQNGYLNFIILDTTDPSILKPLNPKNILTWSSDNEDAISDFLINYIYCTKKKRRSLTIHH
uniref:VWFA domain-containing protein n=1 Tax=Strongyloides papillosus TaxID=174720 RepID=A0A0N5C973_STREA